jgi:serine/threonine protein phosphatase PrpC
LGRLFINLFKKRTKGGVKTTPLSEDELKEALRPTSTRITNQVLTGTAHSIGKQRDHNEDSIFSLTTIRSQGNSDIIMGIYIVADGMGGHLNGELASAAATKEFSRMILSKLLLPSLSTLTTSPNESLQEIMLKAVESTHRAVQQGAPGGGTTLTAALVVGEQVTIAHVGDSRAYFIHPDGRIYAITQDHSLVHRLVELGQLDEKEASSHPQRNVLYRALGQNDPFSPDIASYQVPKPGYLLICSDGLWGVVKDEEIFNITVNAKNPSQACQTLIDKANDAGGPDNVSAVLVQFFG